MPEERKKFPFKIGADPEFNILIQDRHFKAESLFRSLFSSKLTAKEMGFSVPRAGAIGWDGNPDTGELRPLPADSPEALVGNIRELIKTIVNANKIFELSTLSDMGTVGGHIHLDLPPCQSQSEAQNLAMKIHKKLSSLYIPLILGEDLVNLRTRSRGSYGKITDWRIDQLNNNKWLYEFRVPSAEWLTTERTALATIAYVATVYNEIINHPKNFSKLSRLVFKNEKQGLALQELASSHYMMLNESVTGKIKRNIKSFEFYPQYREEIDFVLTPAKVLKEKQEAGFNMTKGWKMVNYKRPSKRQLFARVSDKQLKSLPNLDMMTQIVPIKFNPDINVADFVSVLKQKIAVLDWKLDHIYFFFGLKQGIEDFIIKNKDGEYLYGQEQIKTRADLSEMDKTFRRMDQKFPYLNTRAAGKLENENKQYILIGIPYQLRLALKPREMLERVYEIEKGKADAVKVDASKLPMTIQAKEGHTSMGPIAEIYMAQEEVNLENSLTSPDREMRNTINRTDAENEVRQLIQEDPEPNDNEDEDEEDNNEFPFTVPSYEEDDEHDEEDN